MASSSSHGFQEGGSLADLVGLHVLVVEDSWHVSDAVVELLQSMGAEVSGPAATVAEAERLLSERVPDIAIVDFSLRGSEQADGLIDRLNKQGVCVVVISGHEVLPVEATAFLKKPFTDDQLLAKLNLLLALKGPGKT
jgi:DNA-binding response OmpR family regulator